jgi:alpha-amylase
VGLYGVADVRDHWARLGRFRHAHPAVGAGVHQMIASSPYTFKRTYEKDGVRDRVVVALDLPMDRAVPISVAGVFGKARPCATGTRARRRRGRAGLGGKVQFELVRQAPVALIAALDGADVAPASRGGRRIAFACCSKLNILTKFPGEYHHGGR